VYNNSGTIIVVVNGSVATGVCDFVLGDDYCEKDLVSGLVVICLHCVFFCLFVVLFVVVS